MATQRQATRQTIEQRRALAAWGNILDVETDKAEACATKKQKSETANDLKGEYGTLVRGFPAMVQINGLAATVAFLYAKIKGQRDNPCNPHALLYGHLSEHIKANLNIEDDDVDLMHLIRTGSVDQYRRLTIEIIDYANWLKRYADAKDWKK